MRTRTLVFAAALLGVVSCHENATPPPQEMPNPTPRGSGTWVAAEPTQCLTNPWEQDWLSKHGNDFAAYPRDRRAQNAILIEYYAASGIEVEKIVSVMKWDMVCAACSCPRGDTMYLLVPDDDAAAMVGLGYRLESPPANH